MKQCRLVTDRQAGFGREGLLPLATGRGNVPASPDGIDGRLEQRFRF